MNTKRIQIIFILTFPFVLTIGIMLIPVVADYSNHQLADQAVEHTARWFAGHIISAIGFALSIPAVSTINKHLHLTSRSLPTLILPFIAVGAAFYSAGLGTDGIGPVAVQSAGHSPVIFFDGSGYWITGVFIAGTILFGLGLLNAVIDSIHLGLLKGWGKYVSFVSVLIFIIAPMIPSGWALYGIAVASFGVFVTFAFAISKSKHDMY